MNNKTKQKSSGWKGTAPCIVNLRNHSGCPTAGMDMMNKKIIPSPPTNQNLLMQYVTM